MRRRGNKIIQRPMGGDVDPIAMLVEEGRLNEAFFLARRRATEGQEGAEELLQEISEMM